MKTIKVMLPPPLVQCTSTGKHLACTSDAAMLDPDLPRSNTHILWCKHAPRNWKQMLWFATVYKCTRCSSVSHQKQWQPQWQQDIYIFLFCHAAGYWLYSKEYSLSKCFALLLNRVFSMIVTRTLFFRL